MLQEYLNFAVALGEKAGDIMLKYFRADSLRTDWKADNTPVTIADAKINTLVIEQVKKAYPEHGVMGEEESFEPKCEVVWVVDPIDGTAPYDLGMPNSTFCLALVKDGEVLVSVVLDPFSRRLFSAIQGGGAYKNAEKFTCPENSKLEHQYAFVPSGSKEEPYLFAPFIKDLKQRRSKMLFLPSFTYLATLVLEGKASGVLMSYGSPWDAAAISLIAEEAGATVSDLAGGKRIYNQWGDGILIANQAVHNYYITGIANARSRN